MELRHWTAGRMVPADVKLYKGGRSARIPKLLFPTKLLKGEAKTFGQVFHIFEAHLALTPLGQGIDK